MEPRQGECVTVRPSNHFVKIMLPSVIHGNQLRIPAEFIRRFGDELSNVATITVPDGRVWEMGLKKCGQDVWFCDRWAEFAKYYSIGYGSCLVFKYVKDSDFEVLIFDITAAEICYPNPWCATTSPNPRKRTRVHHVENVNCTTEKRETTTTSTSTGHGRNNQGKRPCNRNHSRALDAAKKLNPKNPSFTSVIYKHWAMYVGADFARSYLKFKEEVKLQISNGKQWKIYFTSHNATTGAMRNGKGWTKFAMDNNVSEGDVCVFELIKKNPVVLQVTILHAHDFADSDSDSDSDSVSP